MNRGTMDPAAVARDLGRAAAAAPSVRLLRGDAVPVEPVRWLWRGYLPAGMLTIIGGAPGCGKTTLALSFAATITRGGTWPDGTRCDEPGDVLFWSGEDAHSVAAARLIAAGADMSRVHFIDGVSDAGDEGFDPGRDMPLLEATAARLPAPRLLILDPIVSAVSGDGHKSNDVRRALQPVVALAQRLCCAVVGITHLTKGSAGRDPIERITGSLAYAALARMVFVVVKLRPAFGDEDGEPRRVMMRAKSNIGQDDGGFVYRLERLEVAPDVEGQRVVWLEALQGTAREILAEAESELQGADEDGPGDAAAWLRDLLGAGALPKSEVSRHADDAGFSWRSVQRAMRRAGVQSRRVGFSKPAEWFLAGSCGAVAPVAPRAKAGANGTTGGDGASGEDFGDDAGTEVF